jgi:hypothetical protein
MAKETGMVNAFIDRNTDETYRYVNTSMVEISFMNKHTVTEYLVRKNRI